jgi:hypothetical protein
MQVVLAYLGNQCASDDFLSFYFDLFIWLMRFHDGSDKGEASGFAPILEKV